MKKIYLFAVIISGVCLGGCFFSKDNRMSENNRVEARTTNVTDILSQEFDYMERMAVVLKMRWNVLPKAMIA